MAPLNIIRRFIMWAYAPKCDLCGKIGNMEYTQGQTLLSHNEEEFTSITLTSCLVENKSKSFPPNTYRFLCKECSSLPFKDVIQELMERE